MSIENAPFVAMFDTTQTGLIWAKVATNRRRLSYTNLKFSEDGQKIIVHSFDSVGTILIIKALDGAFLNSRTYTKSY